MNSRFFSSCLLTKSFISPRLASCVSRQNFSVKQQTSCFSTEPKKDSVHLPDVHPSPMLAECLAQKPLTTSDLENLNFVLDKRRKPGIYIFPFFFLLFFPYR